MTHIAIQESVNGKNVDWLEKVSDISIENDCGKRLCTEHRSEVSRLTDDGPLLDSWRLLESRNHGALEESTDSLIVSATANLETAFRGGWNGARLHHR
jgi:hypothetical protein